MRAALLLCCAICAAGCEQRPTAMPPFDPVGVGFGFDGALLPDGSLAGYDYGGEQRAPSMVLVFVSERYLSASDEQTLYEQSCAAVADFALSPSSPPLPTADDAELYFSYETTLAVTEHSCAGRVDEGVWGQQAEGLWGAFDGRRFGYGFGPMTDALRATWSADALQSLGDSMVAGYVALEDEAGEWAAVDQTTGVLYEYDPITGQIPTERDAYGNEALLPVSALALEDGSFAGAYVRSTPNRFLLGLSAERP